MGNYADDLRMMATMLDEDYHGSVKQVMDRMLRTVGYMLAGDLVTKDFDATNKHAIKQVLDDWHEQRKREFMIAPGDIDNPIITGV